MKITKFCFKVVAIFFLVFLVAQSAQAILTVSFEAVLPINKISYFWRYDTTTANQPGRIINSNPGISFEASDPNKHAKPDYGPPAISYVFGSWDDMVSSETIYIRVWESAKQTEGSGYTNLRGSINNNKALSPNDWDFGAHTWAYEYSIPRQGLIYQSDEIYTVTPPDPTKVPSLKFSSQQVAGSPARESIDRDWQVKLNDVDLDAGWVSSQNGTSITITTAVAGATFNPGDKYEAMVKYDNWLGEGAWSGWATHEVAGAAAAGVTRTVAYSFITNEAFGINQFAIPFGGTITFEAGETNEQIVATMDDLNEAIKDQAGSYIVKTIGWWDKTNQIMVGWTNVDVSPTPQNGAPTNLSGEPLSKNKVYQMSVKKNVSFNLQGPW